jgi:hypothetical protein
VAYIMVESSVRTHHKFLQAGPEASWLWLCGLGYCQEGLTDGFIPTDALRYLGVDKPKRLVGKLVESRLWDSVPGGWQMHDYLAHNKSAEQVRATMRKRGAGGYLGGRPKSETLKVNLQGSDEGLGSGAVEVSDGANLTQNPILPTVLPTDLPTYRESDVPPAWGQRGRGALARADTLVGDHRRCVSCAVDACARGVCIPYFLVQQWLAQLGRRPNAESEIRVFVRSALARLADGPVGDDTLKFWKAEWAAQHGSQARQAAPVSRGAQNVAAVTAAVQGRATRREGGN